MLDRGYNLIYWKVIAEYELKPNHVMLMVLIEALSNKKGACYAGKKYLADTLHLSVPTIYKHMRYLKEVGLLEFVGRSEMGTTLVCPSNEWSVSVAEAHGELAHKEEE